MILSKVHSDSNKVLISVVAGHTALHKIQTLVSKRSIIPWTFKVSGSCSDVS